MNKKQTIFITGTSSGIGKATVLYFLEKGWNVVATMKEKDHQIHFIPHDSLFTAYGDVTDSASIQPAFDAGIAKFGCIDAVVNNAGYGLFGPLELTTEEQVQGQFATNVFGLINVCRIAIPHFRANGSGTIVNISSMLGKITLPFLSMYASTKHAVEGLSEDLYYELKDFNIKVKLIEPGAIQSEFFHQSLIKAESDSVHVYDLYKERVLSYITKKGDTGEAPKVVAEVIYKALLEKNNRLRYEADKTARILLFLRNILPLSLFQLAIRKNIR